MRTLQPTPAITHTALYATKRMASGYAPQKSGPVALTVKKVARREGMLSP
jgi:hypothetical protein